MDQEKINSTIRVLFHQSLVKAGINLKQLTAELSKHTKDGGKKYSYRTVAYQSRIGTTCGAQTPNVLLLTKLAKLPFFWSDANQRYWSVGEIDDLLNGKWGERVDRHLPTEGNSYHEILQKAQLLSRSQRFQLVKELMETLEPLCEERSAMIHFSFLGALRLPSLLGKSLIVLGYGQDYLAAATAVSDKLKGASREEFAACLKAIILRNPSYVHSLTRNATEALAALCCEVESWGADVDDVVINPIRTYGENVEELLLSLSAVKDDFSSSFLAVLPHQ